MIPLHDDVPSARTPVVNYTLIVLNVLAFLYELSLGPTLGSFLREWAVIPRNLTHEWPMLAHGVFRLGYWLPMITAMFLHGGWLHLGGNMLSLWIFGDNVEDRLGHFGYVVFYLVAGIAAMALQVAMSPHSGIPSLGASGAIAGVMGAYLLLYPRAEVLTLVPLGFFLTTMRISAFWFLLIWIGIQALHGVSSIAIAHTSDVGGVAWWAHLGGFAVGLATGFALRGQRGTPPGNPYADRWYSNR